MTRPLFQEPTSEIERPDPWTGPKGFMFGGMLQANAASLAEEYFEGATALIETVKRNEVADYKVANAALFLYRHSFELSLKARLPPEVLAKKRIHDLGKLADSFAHWVRKHDGQQVPTWVIRRLKELAVIDPGSLAFRYGEYLHGDELYIDLYHLQVAMKALTFGSGRFCLGDQDGTGGSALADKREADPSSACSSLPHALLHSVRKRTTAPMRRHAWQSLAELLPPADGSARSSCMTDPGYQLPAQVLPTSRTAGAIHDGYAAL
jgi:hypothetical protein